MPVLLIADHNNESLKDATAKALTAAKKMSDSVHILIAGYNARPAAEAAAKLEGVEKVFLANAAVYQHGLAEPLADLIVALASPYSAIVSPSTSMGKNVMPRVAALLDVMQVSDVSSVVTERVFERPIYAGNAIATVEVPDGLIVATIRTAAFPPARTRSTSVNIEEVGIHPDKNLSMFVAENAAASDRVELTAAQRVVSGGRALGSKENFDSLIVRLADALGAAAGASRAAVDTGYAPNDWQVGQTGKIVAPDLYVAIGISGAIQHLAGMKDAKVIVAINKDEDAPIFQIADFGIVGDLFQIVPELITHVGST
jgi:electron transfer flavoprotein alpha subunit